MADKKTPAEDGAQDTSGDDPFAEFESSEYEAGEEVTSTPTPVREAMGGDGGDDEGGDEGVGEGGDEGDDEGGDGEGESRSKSKGKQTAQERINELTRLRREAERRAEATEAELQRLREEAAARKAEADAAADDGTKGGKKPQPEGENPEDDAPPSPDDFDYGELDPRYIRALAGYEAKQEFNKLIEDANKKAAEERAKAQQAEARQRFEEQIERGSKKHDDYYEKVVEGAEKGQWPLSEHLGMLLVDSEVGDDIAYHLASHPEEAAQVFRQTPLEQARYFGRMESKFTADQSAATGEGAGKTGETRTPKAPPPVKPARGSDGKFSPSASTDDFAAFEAHANSK